MTEQPPRSRRNGLIDGEPMPFVSSTIDEAARTVRISVVQRGSRTVERMQAMMARDQVAIQMPERERPIRATPTGIDITSSGSGGRTLYRMDLMFQLATVALGESSDDVEHAPDAFNAVSPPQEQEDVTDRLQRIEEKLDRILALMERDG